MKHIQIYTLPKWLAVTASILVILLAGIIAWPLASVEAATAFKSGLSMPVLQTTGSISGHVYKADGMTVITDTVISVKATCINPGNCSYSTNVSQIDGSYTLDELTPGTYKVQANRSLAPGYITKYYDDKTGWNEADIIEVVAGQTTANIVLPWEKTAASPAPSTRKMAPPQWKMPVST